MAMYYPPFMVWFSRMRSFVLGRRLVTAPHFYRMASFITNGSGTNLPIFG
jgi:hypothetical protein